ncbi:MAG: peptidoglycan bridge formation glycyltransferase FemA/FemB family protein, partial [Spirochaetaceae bacterium]
MVQLDKPVKTVDIHSPKVNPVSESEFLSLLKNYSSLSDGYVPFLQTAAWASFKQRFGWKPLFYSVSGYPLLVLRRRILREQAIWYVPWGLFWFDAVVGHGPDYESYAIFIRNVSESILNQIQGSRIKPICIRYDAPFGLTNYSCDESGNKLYKETVKRIPGVWRVNHTIQVPTTVMVDLSQPWENILAGMKKKTRYNIRLAERKGVSVRVGN